MPQMNIHGKPAKAEPVKVLEEIEEKAKAMTELYKATSQQNPMANMVELPNSQAAVTSIWMALISLPKIFQHLL